jgi:O-antigen/teichoic acid export membrane protein
MGQFAIAALLVGALVDLVARVTSRVAFPAISRAHARDGTGLVHSYQRLRPPLDAFCLGLAAFLFWFGPDIVRLLYGARYAEAGGFLRILAIALVGSRYGVVPYMYLLLGRPGLMAAEQGFRLCGLLAGIALGYRLAGVTGAVWGVAVGQLAGSLAGLVLFQPGLGLLSVRRELFALALFAGLFGLFGLAGR